MSAGRDDARRLEDLSKVLEVTRAMAAKQELGELLTMLVHSTSEVMDAERSSLFLVDRERDELWSKVAEGDGFTEIRFPASKGLAGHAATTGEVVRIADAYDDERFNQEVDRKTGFRTRSVLCMPLRDHDGQIVGVIQALNKRSPGGEPTGFTDYDEWLLGALAAQAGVSLSQAALLEHFIEKRRMERDLEVARSIQQGLLPAESPEVEGLEFAWHFSSCDETGGDYVDFLLPTGGAGIECASGRHGLGGPQKSAGAAPLSTCGAPMPGRKHRPDGTIGAVIADVSGHGLPAALIMSAVRATVHALWNEGLGPERIAATANDLLEPDLSPDRFVTMFLAGIRPGERVEYVSAGHEPPVLWRARASEFESLGPTGLVLGMLQGSEYGRGGADALESGDVLVVTTDGVFEARDASDEMFGRERLRECVRRSAGMSARAVAEEIASTLSDFVGDSLQGDDITFIVVRAP